MMSERDATKTEWIGAIAEIRDRLSQFTKDSADRIHTVHDREYIQEQGEQIELLLREFAKRFD
jgi:hypothetical protein